MLLSLRGILVFDVLSHCLGLKDQTSNGRRVREDSDSQDDHDCSGHCGTNPKLCPQENQQASNDDIPKERHHEDTIAECPFKPRTPGAQKSIESGNDRDWKEGLQPRWNSGIN
jgi:hypothetical protein